MAIFVRLALGALIAGCAAGAHAQTSTPQTIRVGQTVRGVLEAREKETIDRGWITDFFDLRLAKGERVTITLKSTSFDAYVDLDKDGGHLEADDDSGGGTDAKLVYEADEGGVHRINVTSTNEDGEYGKATGAYSLMIERGGELTVTAQTITPENARRDPPNPQDIRYGQTVQGRITALSPLHEDGTPYLPYLFNARRGDKVTIDMTADGFDAYVVLLDADGDELDTDDDSGGGTNARLAFDIPADGRYEVRANSIAQDSTGDFSLTLYEPGEGPAPIASESSSNEGGASPRPARRSPPPPFAIAFGETARGRLEPGDATADDDTFYDAYRFAGQARQRVTITLRSEDFDAFLALLDADGDEIAKNDDEDDGGTDSKIVFTLPRAGNYVIRANTLTDGETGDYILGLSTSGR